jgi:hypothetical protein
VAARPPFKFSLIFPPDRIAYPVTPCAPLPRLIRLSTSGRELVDGAFRVMSIWRWNSGSAQACQFSSMAPIVYRLDPNRPIAIVATHSVNGTVRWHRWSDGKELLALFVKKNNFR